MKGLPKVQTGRGTRSAEFISICKEKLHLVGSWLQVHLCLVTARNHCVLKTFFSPSWYWKGSHIVIFLARKARSVTEPHSERALSIEDKSQNHDGSLEVDSLPIAV